MLPKVSIIISTYNRAQWVGNAIESALAQNYDNLEIVVTDNASTDNTSDVVKKYLINEKVRYVRNASNLGCFPQVNKALVEHTTGEYFMVVSDDDVLIYRDFLKEALCLFQKDKDITFVWGDWQWYDINTKEIVNKTDWKIPDFAIGNGVELWLRARSIWTLLGSCVFRKDIALRIGGFWNNFGSMDTLFILGMSLEGKFGFLKKCIIGVGSNHESWGVQVGKSIEKQYEQMNYIRILTLLALNKGINSDVVERWRENVLIGSFHAILISILNDQNCNDVEINNNEFMKKLKFLYDKSLHNREEKALVLAMGEILLNNHKIFRR